MLRTRPRLPSPSFGLLVLLVGCGGACSSPGPSYGRLDTWGADVHVYPAGTITGVSAQIPLDPEFSIAMRAGWNETDRRDWGEHDDETGGGAGGGIGLRHWIEPGYEGWLVGSRLDFWVMEIDWVDRPGKPGERRGETEMIVFQPSLEGGYSVPLGGSGARLDLLAGLGVELNAFVDGEAVGQGLIGLLGFNLVFAF